MNNIKLATWFLRIGLAFVFTYASIEMYINPQNFLKYTPSFIFEIVPATLFLHSFGAAELLLALWLLINWKTNYSSILSVILMTGIVLFNVEHFQVLFRNVAIAFGGLALYMLDAKQGASSKNKMEEISFKSCKPFLYKS